MKNPSYVPYKTAVRLLGITVLLLSIVLAGPAPEDIIGKWKWESEVFAGTTFTTADGITEKKPSRLEYDYSDSAFFKEFFSGGIYKSGDDRNPPPDSVFIMPGSWVLENDRIIISPNPAQTDTFTALCTDSTLVLIGSSIGSYGNYSWEYADTQYLSRMQDASVEDPVHIGSSGGVILNANPFTAPLRITTQQPAENIRIYNRAGRQVWEAAYPAHSITWDGRDVSGRMLPAGVYIVHLKTGRNEHVIRIMKR